MSKKFKMASYAIIVALTAVLVLQINAAASQLISPTEIQVAQMSGGIFGQQDKKINKLENGKYGLKRASEKCLAKLDEFSKFMSRGTRLIKIFKERVRSRQDSYALSDQVDLLIQEIVAFRGRDGLKACGASLPWHRG